MSAAGKIAFWTADTGIDGQTLVDPANWNLVCIDPLLFWIWYQDMAFAEAIIGDRAGLTWLTRPLAISKDTGYSCVVSDAWWAVDICLWW